jgi:UrcA family protein
MNTLSTSPSRLIPPAIFCSLALSCGAASIAADNAGVPHAIVKFGELDLSNPQGAAVLYGRIVVAANEVCKSFDIDNRGLTDRWRQYECIQKAIAHAVTKMGRPELFAVYNAKTHRPLPIRVVAVGPR